MVPGLLALCVLVGGGVAPALAQSEWDVKNRLQRMENEIDTLSRAVYRGETPPPGSIPSGGANSADIEIRLQQVENEMRDLRGLLEEQSYNTRQLKAELERIGSDLELRMNDIEGRGGASVQPSTAQRYTTMKNITPSTTGAVAANNNAGHAGYQWETNNAAGTAGQLGSYNATQAADGGGLEVASATYDNAFSMVKNRQYGAAQAEFEVFLKSYPDHALTGNAKYWLGETHYVRGNFDQAAKIFAEGYQKYPKGSKAADNLLKLGLSLDALGKRDDACIALGQLKKENPAGAAPVLRRADQEMTRLGC